MGKIRWRIGRNSGRTGALWPDFPLACSQTSNLNLFFHGILRRAGRITTMQAYQLASMMLMTRERKSFESSNVASLFYSNDGLRNKPSGCNGFGLMGTNGNLLKLEEMSRVKVIAPKHVFFFVSRSPDVILVDVLHISSHQGDNV